MYLESKFAVSVIKYLAIAGLVFALIAPVPPSAAAPTLIYSIVDLGVLPGTSSSEAHSVNDSGQVTGDSFMAGSGQHRAFFYSGGQLVDIGTLGGNDMRAAAINSSGAVVGTADGNRAFLYHDGVLQNLGTLPGDAFSNANDINDAGIIVGGSSGGTSTDIPGPRHAFIYRDGVMLDIGAPSGFNGIIFATAINNRGQVLCVAGRDDTARAFLYQNGAFQELFSLWDNHIPNFDLRINNDGVISGWSSTNGAFVYRDGTFTFFGSLGGNNCPACVLAHGINDAGEVVGQASVPNSTSFHAFLYSDGVTRDLNNLIQPGSGWELNVAWDINNVGQIAGLGTINGQIHAFLLTPVTPNAPWILTEGSTNHAVAVDSVTMVRDPFPIVNTQNFSADQRTRVSLFVRNILLSAGEGVSALQVTAEDPQQHSYPVVVEAASRLSQTNDLSQIVILLPEIPEGITELRFTLVYHSTASNQVYVKLKG
jgi:probable HAF family extracellular repeat protein